MTKNKFLKPFISTIISFLVIIAIFSIFKGPNYIFVKYYYYSGFAKQKSKNLVGAIEDYSKAISLDKTHSTSYISRGSAYMDLKKYQEAILDYSKVIELKPNESTSFAYRGRAYYEINNPEKSIADFDKAISLDKNFGYAFLNRALVKYTILKDFNGGCEDLKKASELGESEAKEHLKKGYCD
jgi:tetratricopeptide (TPR) repeat protein